MSGPVDVLAWLDSLHVTDADGAVTNRKWPEAQEARAAVAELIEAATGLERCFTENGKTPLLLRLRAALARVQP